MFKNIQAKKIAILGGGAGCATGIIRDIFPNAHITQYSLEPINPFIKVPIPNESLEINKNAGIPFSDFLEKCIDCETPIVDQQYIGVFPKTKNEKEKYDLIYDSFGPFTHPYTAVNRYGEMLDAIFSSLSEEGAFYFWTRNDYFSEEWRNASPLGIRKCEDKDMRSAIETCTHLGQIDAYIYQMRRPIFREFENIIGCITKGYTNHAQVFIENNRGVVQL